MAEYLEERRGNKARKARMQAKASTAKLAAKSRKQEQGTTEEGLALQEHSRRGSAAQHAQQALPSLGAAARVYAFVQRTWLTRPLATFLTPTGSTTQHAGLDGLVGLLAVQPNTYMFSYSRQMLCCQTCCPYQMLPTQTL